MRYLSIFADESENENENSTTPPSSLRCFAGFIIEKSEPKPLEIAKDRILNNEQEHRLYSTFILIKIKVVHDHDIT